MPATRRHVLLSAGLFAPFSGCTAIGGSTVEIVEFQVDLVNVTDFWQVFHFAIETNDGLGAWESHLVAPGTRESAVKRPDGEFDPVAIHGVVDDHTVRGELIGADGRDDGELCLRVVFEYGLGEEPTFLESTDVRCG